MGTSEESTHLLDSKGFPTLKVTAIEETLTQAIGNFRDLVLDFEQLHIENRNYKKMFKEQKVKLENQSCSRCDNLEKIIAAKEQILLSLASGLTQLNQTKDLTMIQILLKQINGDTDVLTLPDSVSPQKDNNQNHVLSKENIKEEKNQNTFKSPKKEEHSECQDESVSEIEGTPTGRKSPILQSKSKKTNSISLKDKKKCPYSWPTPESKSIKLTYPSPTQSKSGGRMRQGRLSFVKIKSCSVVDLTCSPENSGEIVYNEYNKQYNVKKEIIDNDETIMPSPTSAVHYPPLYDYKSIANSPTKFQTVSKFKIKTESNNSNVENVENKVIQENEKYVDDSVNILKQYLTRVKSPKKIVKVEDEAHCDDSISLLQRNIKQGDTRRNNMLLNSPSKRPLAENVNVTNTQNHENESSMSILREPTTSRLEKANDDVKRVKTNMAPVYKEPTVRKKAEKRALLGWSCDDCKNFYDELYKDNPAMLAQKMDECSKHRGRTNPIRPKTPEGFWNPRWDVPQDTEEFNRRNNAI